MMAAMRRLRERPDVRVVTGVNLAMLLEFLFHREEAVTAAAQRAVTAGGDAIRSA
jgi:mannose/fructose-specific phosphotransferase system component IIA